MPENIVKIRLPQLEPLEGIVQPEDQIFVYDGSSSTLKRATISQLPSSGSGSSVPSTVLPAEIILNNGSGQYQEIADSVDVGITNTVISDTRLIGATGYSVRTTQLNIPAFRFDQLIYNPTDGKVTIKNFVLEDDELIIIAAPGTVGSNSGVSLEVLLARVSALEAMTAPFKPWVSGPSKARIFFEGTSEELALYMPGWEFVPGWEGKTLVIVDPDDTDFNAPGLTGGNKTLKLAVNQIPEMDPANGDYKYLLRKSIAGQGTTNKYFDSVNSGNELDLMNFQEVKKIGTPVADQASINLTQRYRTGRWIHYVGV